MSIPDDAEPTPDLLRCGRPVPELLDQVAAGRADELDVHQQRCPHCQAALGEYARLWSPLTELSEEQVRAPDSVIDSALRRLRGAVEHVDYGVIDTPQGRNRISARVVVVAARVTAEAVPGVRVALSRRIEQPSDVPVQGPASESVDRQIDDVAQVIAGVAGRTTAVEITLAAEYGQDLVALGEQVRRQVIDRVRAMTDLDPVHVTVVIDDVFTPDR